MRNIGLHLQIDDTLTELANKAKRFEIRLFQCFLALRTEGRLASFTQEDIDKFILFRRKYFDQIYLHSSYWVNLSDVKRKRHPLLEKEISLAKQLEFTHIVLHAGSSKGARNKKEAINALARSIDRLLSQDHGLTVVLENVAHGGKAVGNDLSDFRLLLKLIDQPEKLRFCIDVAHAYLFGYDISSEKGQEKFIELVDEVIGWSNVELIHLNDTKEECGSKIDKHFSVGDGSIGNKALKRFILHPKIINIPVLMEVPVLTEEHQKKLLEKVRGWHLE